MIVSVCATGGATIGGVTCGVGGVECVVAAGGEHAAASAAIPR
jgi:hypothetical protein